MHLQNSLLPLGVPVHLLFNGSLCKWDVYFLFVCLFVFVLLKSHIWDASYQL